MLNNLKIKNWKSHSDSEYEFSPGVNIIVGSMGAGKSSILQAITFALFGSLPEIKSRDVKTVELVNRHPHADEAHIKLLFSQSQEFAVLRSISKKDGTGNATIRDAQDQLVAGPKSTAATAFVSELLKTDLDTYLRTVYAKQNEIDLFLKYSPADRKKYIDELMKLDKFELARKHSTQLQNKIKVRLDESQKLLEITDKEKLASDINQLSQELASLENQKKTASTHIEKARNNEQLLKQKLNALREKKSKVDGLNQSLILLNNQISQLKDKLKNVSLEASKQEILSQIQTLQSELSVLKNKKSETRTQIDALENKKLAIERELAVLASKEKELAKLSEAANQIDTQRPSLTADFEDIKKRKEEITDTLANKNAELNNIIEHLDELKKAESVCPICTTKLTSKIKQQLIGKRKQQIIDLTKEKSVLDEKLKVTKKKFEDLEELNEKRKNLGQRLEDLKKSCEEIATMHSEKEKIEIENQINNIKNQISTLETNIDETQNKINSLTEQKSLYDAKEQLDVLEKQQSDAQASLAELSFDPVILTETESQYTSALQKVQELVSQQQNFDLLISEKNKRRTELVEQQTKLAQLLDIIHQCANKIELLTKFNNALLMTQESLRVDLISTVNEVMSNVWADLYPYEKWQDIRLLASEADYKLQLCGEDGDWVSVAGFASGGERMLAALALRIAFAKVLAPHLSLLILDEPTHNLDQKAIDTFLDVLQNKLANYLEQVFIITHDPKLAEVGNVIEV